MVGVLARDIAVRLLNCSPSGCLLETNVPMEVGTIGSLRLEINGQELVDHILVVRCHQIQGAGSIHHVGAKFLLTETPARQTVRHAIGQATAQPIVSFPGS
jgi:hypothetical protein